VTWLLVLVVVEYGISDVVESCFMYTWRRVGSRAPRPITGR